ncbi:MAG: hypothetical protein OHK0024_05690 [Thalassobaculales bacterium]
MERELTADPKDALVLDLIEWLAPAPRPYAEVMEAWRTSCPRLTVWEDAEDRGYVARRRGPDGAMVQATPAGLAFLDGQRPGRAAAAAR